jgi:hypothetical protein
MRVQHYGSSEEFEDGLAEMLKLGYNLNSWQMAVYAISDEQTCLSIVAVYKNKSLM